MKSASREFPRAPSAGKPASRIQPFLPFHRFGALPFRAAKVAIALAAAFFAAVSDAPPSAAAAPLPAWVLTGTADLAVPVGLHDMTGSYSLTLDGQTQQVSLAYQSNGTASGGGFFANDSGIGLFSLLATQELASDGSEVVTLREASNKPRFTFQGTMEPGGGGLVGMHTRSAGFAGLMTTSSGPLTIPRVSPAQGSGTFRLQAKSTTDNKGRVRGGLAVDGVSEDRAFLTVFGSKMFSGGKIRGRIRTDRMGATTGDVSIKGTNWSVRLRGPLDIDGFHAMAKIKAGGFVVKNAPITLNVQEGPEPPPPPPPPPPKNQLEDGVATITGGQVQILRDGVPKKFFGARGAIEVQFPASFSTGTFHADPGSSSGADPRRFIVRLGSTTFGTATAPADVTVEVQRFSSVRGGTITLLCTGKVATSAGKTKSVSVLLVATVN